MTSKRAAGSPAARAAFLWSLTAVPLGLWQLLAAERGPFSDPMNSPTIPLHELVPSGVGPALLIAAGLAGLAAPRLGPRRWPVAAAYAVVFGMLVPTTSVIAMAGYLCALVLPPALLAGPVLLARGRTAKAIAGAAVLGIVVALAAAGPLRPAVVSDLLAELGSGVADLGLFPLAELWSAIGGACWAALAVRMLLAGRDGASAPAWLAPERAERWGKTASYVAFACALPYGLTRLTWLTPWPFLMDAEELDAEPGMRLWGLLLGFAALGGGVLCLGLTRRWGERWPYWVPGLAGRPVPPRAAIVPASVAAYLFTITAVPFVRLAFEAGRPELVWVFPFYVWGPALGAATLAYAVRRGAVRAVR
ncbi:hypothetical protein GCM10027447_24770 [Glycomyces halotolerans]